jgi:hypothetical protein
VSPLGLYAVRLARRMRRALVVDNRDHRPVYCSRHQRGFQVGRRAARSFSERWPAIPLWFLIFGSRPSTHARGAACGLPLNLLSVAAWRWWCVRATGALCAASTHAGTDVRPIARCLRYGKLAPINNDVIPAMKRPNAIHLGCMVNLSLDGPRHPHTVLRPLAQGGGQ